MNGGIRIQFYDGTDIVVEKGRTWTVSERGDLSIYSNTVNSLPLATAAYGGWKSVEVLEDQKAA